MKQYLKYLRKALLNHDNLKFMISFVDSLLIEHKKGNLTKKNLEYNLRLSNENTFEYNCVLRDLLIITNEKD